MILQLIIIYNLQSRVFIQNSLFIMHLINLTNFFNYLLNVTIFHFIPFLLIREHILSFNLIRIIL
jgi:hypothetical protein